MLAELFMLLFMSFRGITASRCNSNADRVHGVHRRTAHDICVQPAGGHAGRRAVNVGSYGVSCAPPPLCVMRQRSTSAPAGTAISAGGSAPLPACALPAVPPSSLPAFESLLQRRHRGGERLLGAAGGAVLDVWVLLVRSSVRALTCKLAGAVM